MTRHGGYRSCTSSLARPLIDIGSVGSTGLTVLYDNSHYDPELKTGWGFSCYIKVRDMKILFDTGGDPKILFHNMDRLGVTVDEIGIIALSHIHGDHVGGLFGILNKNSRIEVYVPASFPANFKSRIKSFGCGMVEVEESLKICDGVMTTGELRTDVKEQSLIINSLKGLIVVTGCAHPGVVDIVEKALELVDGHVYLVIGGFHLGGASKEEIKSIIEQFRSLGVTKVAPCHCSGDLARSMFKGAFGRDYIETGVGKTLEIGCLGTGEDACIFKRRLQIVGVLEEPSSQKPRLEKLAYHH